MAVAETSPTSTNTAISSISVKADRPRPIRLARNIGGRLLGDSFVPILAKVDARDIGIASGPPLPVVAAVTNHFVGAVAARGRDLTSLMVMPIIECNGQ